MSLIVWLPLNGSTKNKGLSTVSFVNNNSYFNTDGKLGKCLLINGLSASNTVSQLTASTPTVIGSTELSGEVRRFSIAFWVKALSSTSYTAWSTTFNIGFNNVSNEAKGKVSVNNNIWLLRGSLGSTASVFNGLYWYLKYKDSSGNTQEEYHSGISTDGTWLHIVMTCDGEYFRYYINGKYNTQFKLSDYLYSYQLTGYVRINSANAQNELNDFRIYNHCLSVREISELSKGLVLHYPLNIDIPKANLLKGNTSLINSGLTGMYRFTGCNSTTSYAFMNDGLHIITPSTGNQNNGYMYTYNDYTSLGISDTSTITFSFNVKGTSDSNTPFVSLKYKTSTSTSIDYWWQDVAGSTVSFTPTSQWKRYSITITLNNSCSYKYLFIGFHGNYLSDLYFRDIKLELGSTATTYNGNTTTIRDTSGYGNDGTITGTLTTSTSTKRFDKCTCFDNNAIKCKDPLNTSLTTFTISFWAKFNNSNTGCIWNGRTYVGSSYAIFWISNSIRFDTGNGSDYMIYSSSLSTNTWYFITCIKNGDNKYIYVNNSLNASGSSGPVSKSNTYATIGMSSVDSDPANNVLQGYLSDFRIYSTALSDDSIKKLYNESTFISKTGSIGSFQFNEISNSNPVFNYTDTSNITLNGWGGTKTFSSDGYLILKETNGWEAFGFNTSNFSGSQVMIDFDYRFTDTTNIGSGVWVNVGTSVEYISSLKNLSNVSNWTHFHLKCTASTYFIIMIRGTDNAGTSCILNIKNMTIKLKTSTTSKICKNGQFKSECFKDDALNASMNNEIVNGTELIEI